MKSPEFLEELYSRKRAAEYLGNICLTTLDRLNLIPTRIRRRVFFRKSVLDKYLEEHTQRRCNHDS